MSVPLNEITPAQLDALRADYFEREADRRAAWEQCFQCGRENTYLILCRECGLLHCELCTCTCK